MNSKILSIVINAVVAFAAIAFISFFMNKLINHSEESFVEYFQKKWFLFLGFVIFFVGYKHFFKKKEN
nr:hypothetical protein [uncultured Chryseobacterium sp.]